MNNEVIVYLRRRNGQIFETIIDFEDLEKIKQFTWHVGWRKCINNFYVESCEYLGMINGKPKYKTICLHNFIMSVEKNEVIDHIDHNPLNNTKSNLRKTNKVNNGKNRKSKNSNNTSGFRNVSWLENEQKYIVQLQIDGVNTRLGSFIDVNEAGEFANEMRQKYYGIYKGNA